MKIAVIGTGIAGNMAAYSLQKEHDITVFEANDYVGGHTHTHDIEWAGKHYAVDTGFIVFNEKTYPNFIALLDELGVASKPTTMSFSVKSAVNGLEYNGNNLNSLFAQRRNLASVAFYRMINDILRFNRQAPKSLLSEEGELGLGDYLQKHKYSQMFIDHYIIPMGAAIWSTDPAQMQDFPAKFFIRFFENHGLLNVVNRPRWYVVEGGSKSYLEPLTRSFAERIRLNARVEFVKRFPTHVEVKAFGQSKERFDAVFIASHSDQALGMLADASQLERDVLGAIRYQGNSAVLHTDASILPQRRLAWAAWNYHLLPDQNQQVALTYNMNMLQGLSAPVQFCVTLNHTDSIDEKQILKELYYEHPIYTPESVAAQQRHGEVNGINRTYYCGAYWRNGFHEDGVVSALNALEHLRRDEREQRYLQRAS